jgi:uncharacterized membrane protein YjdF
MFFALGNLIINLFQGKINQKSTWFYFLTAPIIIIILGALKSINIFNIENLNFNFIFLIIFYDFIAKRLFRDK